MKIFFYLLYVYLQEISDIWNNERLLNVVEQFIGPEIAGHPVWNIRCKVSALYSFESRQA